VVVELLAAQEVLEVVVKAAEMMEHQLLELQTLVAAVVVVGETHQVLNKLAQLAVQESSSSNIPTIILSPTVQVLPSQQQHQALSKSQHLPQALAQLVSRRKGNNDNQLNANRLHRRQDFCG
jgi:hypothetical protein